MKTAKSIIVVLFVLLTAQIASAYYCPSTGRWLSRDPIGEPGFQAVAQPGISTSLPPSRWVNRDSLNSILGKQARLEFLLMNYDFDGMVAHSIARNLVIQAEYIAGNNGLIGDFDILGLCVDLPDSGPGSFASDIILHKIGKHFPPLKDHHSTLTFKVCCPDNTPVLQKSISQSAEDDVVDPPPPTENGNAFPYSVLQGPSGNGPCYTIVLEVPSTIAAQYDLGDQQVQWFIKSIKVHGTCCCK
jgi:hypothetical protein